MIPNIKEDVLVLLTVTHIPTKQKYYHLIGLRDDEIAGTKYKSFCSYFNHSQVFTFKENEIVTKIQY